MNTPAHLILNAVVLGWGRTGNQWLSILAGAVLPDLPMLAFYLFERFGLGQSEERIWSVLYFDPDWQTFFDVFNSLPLIAVGLGVALARRSPAALAFFLSMALHVAGDLPLHHDDAHGHFFPFSNWRFESPLSYWDPAHYGTWIGSLEIVGVIAGSLLLVRRGRPWRIIGLATLVLYALFGAFALRYWAGLPDV
ncbi:MAG TPA: hypothetical protein ENI85_14135 [Deltaproteobacteria bacterium]|nr:hypothetical protein [Deltaproteobacteria bacterium]